MPGFTGDSERDDQYESRNQRYPDGWENMVADMFSKKRWTLYEATNLICGLDPQRISYTKDHEELQSPDNWVIDHSQKLWRQDAIELRFWKIFNMAKSAADAGDLVTLIAEPETTSEARAAFGHPRALPRVRVSC